MTQVSEPLLQDHRHMETLFEQFLALLGKGPDAADGLVTLLATLKRRTDIHMACEERGLFPVLSKYHSMVLMEVEHEDLLRLGKETQAALDALKTDAGRWESFEEVARRFIREHRDHFAREEAGIFPEAETDLDADEKDIVLAKIAEIREIADQGTLAPVTRPEKSFQEIAADMDTRPERAIHAQTLAEADGCVFKQITLRGGESLARHWTPKKALVWCLDGEAVWTDADPDSTRSGEAVPLQRGKGVLLSPRLLHAVQAKTDSRLLLVLLD